MFIILAATRVLAEKTSVFRLNLFMVKQHHHGRTASHEKRLVRICSFPGSVCDTFTGRTTEMGVRVENDWRNTLPTLRGWWGMAHCIGRSRGEYAAVHHVSDARVSDRRAVSRCSFMMFAARSGSRARRASRIWRCCRL